MKKTNTQTERRCRICGCTDNDCRQCIEKTGSPCSWIDEDLCSACSDHQSLTVYTIYNSPHDFPGDYVISKWDTGPRDEPVKDLNFMFINKDLEACRDKLRKMGLYCLGRDPEDDLKIVESWI